MKRITALLVMALLAFAAAGVVAWNQLKVAENFFDATLHIADSQNFAVVKGDGITQVINRLGREGFVNEPPSFLGWHIRYHKLDFSIQKGNYLLTGNMTVRDALLLFNKGKVRQTRITLVEGQTLNTLLPQLQNNPDLVNDLPTVTKRSDYSAFAKSFLPDSDATNLEGAFLADTFFFAYGTRVSNVLRRAMKAREEVLEKIKADCDKLPQIAGVSLSTSEVVILASIVEKETAKTDERPKIAAVFLNRLKKDMRLQTDPTVIYGLGDDYKGNITRKHLTTPTGYNTYTQKGLPPTPISSVGRDALYAVCNPHTGFLEKSMLFFVAKGDGSHHFSPTYKEHSSAVRKYQLKRRADYRSTPSR